jgi:hypothetical protein
MLSAADNTAGRLQKPCGYCPITTIVSPPLNIQINYRNSKEKLIAIFATEVKIKPQSIFFLHSNVAITINYQN